MRKSGVIRRKVGFIDPQLWVDEWRRVHPHKTAVHVAGAVGAPLKTVDKWLSGQSAPSLRWLGAIFTAYGAGFVVSGMTNPPAWLVEAARQEKRQQLAAARAAIEAEFVDLQFEGLEA